MIFKLDSNGLYQWHTFYGATGKTDMGDGIAIDGNNNIYVGGYSNSTWNGPNATAPLNPYSSDYDIFIFTLNGKSTLTENIEGTGTVTSNPSGIGCTGDCSEVYDDGTQINLSALAGIDFEFIRWSGDCSGSDTTTSVTINGNKTGTAFFENPFHWELFLPTITSQGSP